MKIPSLGELELGAVIVGVGIAGFLLYKVGKAVTPAIQAGAVNPNSTANVVYQGAGAVVQTITDGAEETVGGVLARIREVVSGDDAKIRALLGGSAGQNRNNRAQTRDPNYDYSGGGVFL